MAIDPIAFPLPDAPRTPASLAGVGAPPPDQSEVVLRHRRLRRHRPRRAARAGDRAEPAGRDRRPSRPVAEQGVLVRHDRPGLRRLRAGHLGSQDLARRRSGSGGDLDGDRGNARNGLRLRRRVGRRRDQHGDQHLHRHPGAAAADRRLLVPPDPRAGADGADPRPDDVGSRGAHPPQPGALAEEPRLRAGGEGLRRRNVADRLRRDHAEHDQPDRCRLPARLLPLDHLRRRARVPRVRRREQDHLGDDALLGAEQLLRAPGRVVALRLPGRRARTRRSRRSCSSTTASTSSRTRACVGGGRQRGDRSRARRSARDRSRRRDRGAAGARRPRRRLPRGGRSASRRRSRQPDDSGGRDRRPRRRVRLRQDHHGERDPEHPAAARGGDRRPDPVPRRRRRRPEHEGAPPLPLAQRLDGLPERDERAQPGHARRRPVRGHDESARAREQARRAAAGRRPPQPRRASTAAACARTRTSSPAACVSA